MEMLIAMNKEVEKHFPRKEHVLLRFNKRDSQIARDWSKSKTKDIFDDKK
jgi:hypothetical protein